MSGTNSDFSLSSSESSLENDFMRREIAERFETATEEIIRFDEELRNDQPTGSGYCKSCGKKFVIRHKRPTQDGGYLITSINQQALKRHISAHHTSKENRASKRKIAELTPEFFKQNQLEQLRLVAEKNLSLSHFEGESFNNYFSFLMGPEVPPEKVRKLQTSRRTLTRLADTRAFSMAESIALLAPKAAKNGKLSLSFDHNTLPNYQKNEAFTSNLGISLTVSGENEKKSYMLDFSPVEPKDDKATEQFVRKTAEKYNLTDSLQNSEIPVIADCAARGAAKKLSDVYGICASHNTSNVLKNAVKKKQTEFGTSLDEKFESMTELLKSGNEIIPQDRSLEAPKTINIFLKQQELSEPEKDRILAIRDPKFQCYAEDEKQKMRNGLQSLPKMKTIPETRFRYVFLMSERILIVQPWLQNPDLAGSRLFGSISFVYVKALHNFSFTFNTVIDLFESDLRLNYADIIPCYEFLIIYCADLYENESLLYNKYLNDLKRGGLAAITEQMFQEVIINLKFQT